VLGRTPNEPASVEREPVRPGSGTSTRPLREARA